MEPAKEKIKGCPHCGGNACLNSSYSYKSRTYFVFVKCDICGAQAKVYSSDTEPAADNWNNQSCIDAVKAWNMRHSEEA